VRIITLLLTLSTESSSLSSCCFRERVVIDNTQQLARNRGECLVVLANFVDPTNVVDTLNKEIMFDRRVELVRLEKTLYKAFEHHPLVYGVE
jgi:hypothetical protein